jgi:hypothetical protein
MVRSPKMRAREGSSMIAGALAFAALATLAACVDTQDLSGGVTDAAACDGTTCADAAQPPPAPDAASDAGGGSDAADAGPTPIFCDGFERADVLGDWDSKDVEGAATLSIDNGTAGSGGKSLRIDLAGRDAGGSAGFLTRSFPLASGTTALTTRLSLRIDALPDSETHGPGLALGTSPLVYLTLLPTGARLAEQSADLGSYADEPFSGLTPGVWHTVVLRIDGATKPPQFAIDVDGSQRYAGPLLDDAAPVSPARPLVGFTYASAGAPFSMWLDDFCLYAE